MTDFSGFDSLDTEENRKIIGKYIDQGIVKKFEFREYQYSDQVFYFLIYL